MPGPLFIGGVENRCRHCAPPATSRARLRPRPRPPEAVWAVRCTYSSRACARSGAAAPASPWLGQIYFADRRGSDRPQIARLRGSRRTAATCQGREALGLTAASSAAGAASTLPPPVTGGTPKILIARLGAAASMISDEARGFLPRATLSKECRKWKRSLGS
jgi:hypothetical protein